MCGSRQFCQRGSNSTLKTFFFPSVILVRIQIPLKAGAIIMDCWFGSFVNFQGIRTSIAKKSIFSWFFKGGPDALPPPPSLDPPMPIWTASRETLFSALATAFAYAQSVLHEKTVPMHRLICAFIVRMQQNQG